MSWWDDVVGLAGTAIETAGEVFVPPSQPSTVQDAESSSDPNLAATKEPTKGVNSNGETIVAGNGYNQKGGFVLDQQTALIAAAVVIALLLSRK